MKIPITTYAQLAPFVHGVAQGHLGLLIIIGGPGLQKTILVEEILGDKARYIRGTTTGFELYREVWRHKGKIMVIDDVDGLYSDRPAVRVLKNLTDTRESKWVSWHSASTLLDQEGIPREFATTSRVVIIANQWGRLTKNLGALEDRGTVLEFDPDAVEVHQRVSGWFGDEEIYRFIGQHLSLITKPSMRYYVEAARFKAAGLDWRTALLRDWGLDASAALVARLQSDPSFASQEDRARAFTAQTNLSRRTYFNTLKKVRRATGIPCTPAPATLRPVQKCNQRFSMPVAAAKEPAQRPERYAMRDG